MSCICSVKQYSVRHGVGDEGFAHFTETYSWKLTCSREVDRIIGLVVKVSASKAEDPWFDSCLHCGDFSGSSHTCDLKIGTPVATLPEAWSWDWSAGCGYTVTG